MATLGEFYREHGESEHVLRLEAALTGEWCGRLDVAEAAGVSPQFAFKALPYLLEEGRAQRRRSDSPEFRPHGWRWEWRRPAA